MKGRLFLLKPGFMDQGRDHTSPPGCVVVEGMLSFYPGFRDKIEVNYIDFPRPRPGLVALIGAENQSCPKLILGGEHLVPEGVARSAKLIKTGLSQVPLKSAVIWARLTGSEYRTTERRRDALRF